MENYIEYFKRDRFAAFNGIELAENKPGYAKTRVKIGPDHLNGVGVVHGGLLFTLADFAFAAAVNAYGFVTLSISSSISYFHKSSEGIIFAEAKVVSRSNRIIHCDITILHDSRILLANFKGTGYITKQEISF